MDFVYLGILLFLLGLAVFDLNVGVANDAVNFLSPAVGAKVAKFRTILIVAALGIFIGASTSGGMMDVARHGIFIPSQYTFEEVMCIFLAVVATDITLMDIFNTLGMPTSTTVSLVFGLLGSSTALAMTKMFGSGMSYGDLINTDKALTVIFSIFLSVAIAFVVGLLVMWITRLVFTFQYKKHLRWSIALFGGFSVTVIMYFLLVIALGSSRIIPAEVHNWINENTLPLVGSMLIGFTIIMEICHLLHVNIFKIIVLFGTFSLAMAFAGNDLVNFIGVPLAGLESYLDYSANSDGLTATAYHMNVLSCQGSTLPHIEIFLVIAGLIMTFAICTSKKAHKVIETSVNLSRQDESEEVFSSSKIARKMVRSVLNTSSYVSRFLPNGVMRWVDRRFNVEDAQFDEGVAFDMVRASVNLVLSGLLIVLGTSLQLPLSTTYVAFMVAMGTSLADRAWGRETAVYRITGVISVIGGWFITAGAAFLIAFTIATLNHYGGFIVMILVMAMLACVLVNNNRTFKKKQREAENVDNLFRELVHSQDKQRSWQLLARHVADTQANIVSFSRKALQNIINGLVNEDLRSLRQADVSLNEMKARFKRYRRKEIVGMRKIDPLQSVEKNTWFHLGCNSCSQLIYCLKRLLEPCFEHVDNNFSPLPKEYAEELKPIVDETEELLVKMQGMIETGDYDKIDEVVVGGSILKGKISKLRQEQQVRIARDSGNIKVEILYLNALQEIQELISHLRHLLRAARHFQLT